jgi:SAM-dependent methyltransferase
VGAIRHLEKPMARYEARGEAARKQIISMLPGDWDFEGRRILDFGCGAGRTLRHFLSEAERAEFSGCDIDEPSVAWVKENLSPPIDAFRCGETPPIPRADGHFDLIYAISVFTHLADSWSRWMLELHRLLRDDGFLIATYAGKDVVSRINETWDPDRIGMNVLRTWQSWDEGGPVVLHSDWWIRAHWDRAFEILDLRPPSEISDALGPQTWVLMRKRPGSFAPADLEAIEPGEEREVKAMRHNIRQLQAEAAEQRHALLSEVEALRRESRVIGRTLQGITNSRSWRITRPLRALTRRRKR